MAVLPPGGSFVDDDGNVHEGGIEAIAAEGITLGCNPPANDRYCPEKTVTRGQMAVFLARALDLGPTSNDYFIDDETSLFEAGINRLRAAGITQGCNPPANNRFCPDRDMTRGEMAAMLARAFNYPVSNHNRFNDDNGHIFEQAIQKIAAAGVTVGCNPPANNRFCPNDPIRRDQMATLLTRANHQMIGECDGLTQAAAMAGTLGPDVVLLDVDGSHGEDQGKLVELRNSVPFARLIALGSPPTCPAEINGVQAYLSKPCTPEAVLAAIVQRRVANGILPA